VSCRRRFRIFDLDPGFRPDQSEPPLSIF